MVSKGSDRRSFHSDRNFTGIVLSVNRNSNIPPDHSPESQLNRFFYKQAGVKLTGHLFHQLFSPSVFNPVPFTTIASRLATFLLTGSNSNLD